MKLRSLVALHLCLLGVGAVHVAGSQCSEHAFLKNTCKPNGAYKKVAVDDPSGCCGACADEGSSCGSWVYKKSTTPNCHLHPDGPVGLKDGSCTTGPGGAPIPPTPTPPLPLLARNLLYVVVDDLRTEIAYADKRPGLITPNIDALASKGTVFGRAYVQIGVCSPSRNSFLSGRRPDTTKIWNFKDSFRTKLGDVSSWPGAFKNAGYTSVGLSKVYHPGHPANDDGDKSWSIDRYPYYHPSNFVKKISDKPDSHFQDGMTVDAAVETIQKLAVEQAPFFLAVGIHKPHVPWVMPQRFLHMQLSEDETDTAIHDSAPTGYCNVSMYRCPGALSGDHAAPLPWEPAPKSDQRKARRLYRASVSWMDYLVGRLLGSLDSNNLTESTAVVFHGDHGWHLGEHGLWCKQSNFELVARVPLIVSVPWLSQSHGKRNDAIVELVDLMPTTLDLMGLTSSVPDFGDLEGTSFLPLLDSPEISPESWKTAAFTQFPRCNGTDDLSGKTDEGTLQPWDFPTNNPCTGVTSADFQAMGLSMRTLHWRYTLWLRWDGQALAPMWDEDAVGEELYDHVGDTGDNTDDFEHENLADSAEHSDVKAQLKRQLRDGWRAAAPSTVQLII